MGADVQDKAQAIEKEIKSGHIEDAAVELHKLSPDQRKQIAEQIQKDQKEKPSDGLPPLTFYDSGDLKSADTAMDEHTKIHTEYDKNTGRRKSEDYTNDNNSSSHWEYNTRTGNSVSGTYKYGDGSTSHSEVDPKTNKPWFVDTDGNNNVVETKGTDGKVRKFHYDENNKVDSIDGHLGRWDRSTDAQGRSSWINRDNGSVWEGDMNVDKNGNIHYQGRNGSSWVFTRDGQDIRKS